MFCTTHVRYPVQQSSYQNYQLTSHKCRHPRGLLSKEVSVTYFQCQFLLSLCFYSMDELNVNWSIVYSAAQLASRRQRFTPTQDWSNISYSLTKSGSVKSFCGSRGSAGESFSTMLAVFDIINPNARSHTEYNFYMYTICTNKKTQ